MNEFSCLLRGNLMRMCEKYLKTIHEYFKGSLGEINIFLFRGELRLNFWWNIGLRSEPVLYSTVKSVEKN